MRKNVVLLTVLLCLACGRKPKVESGGIEVYASIWERTENEIRLRASVDLGCPPDDIVATLAQKQGKYPTVVHARCNDIQAIYSRRLRHSMGRTTTKNTVWVLESRPPGQPGQQ